MSGPTKKTVNGRGEMRGGETKPYRQDIVWFRVESEGKSI